MRYGADLNGFLNAFGLVLSRKEQEKCTSFVVVCKKIFALNAARLRYWTTFLVISAEITSGNSIDSLTDAIVSSASKLGYSPSFQRHAASGVVHFGEKVKNQRKSCISGGPLRICGTLIRELTTKTSRKARRAV